MHTIPENETPLHRSVVQDSFQTYLPLRGQGYEVTANPLGTTNRWVGGENNKIYPDIILWRPNPNSPTSGTAVTVEQIETQRSIELEQNIDNWAKLATLKDVEFVLVVPVEIQEAVQSTLKTRNIQPKKFQVYEYNPTQNRFIFRDIT
ncbi:MAG: hypothetical protein MUP45_04475 [Candidatus Marinimicrobia bacterium]|nr:hypothetical protein [Candidatus Neomarinimicrobiota bacterium]